MSTVTSRRRYTRRTKNTAVAEAERTSITAAAESLGIPRKTVAYWYDSAEFADIRRKTRDELAEGSVAMALLAQGELVRRIQSGNISDQALVAAFGVGIDKAQLLSGAATSRTEARDITGTISDVDLAAALATAHALTTAPRGPDEAEDSPEG